MMHFVVHPRVYANVNNNNNNNNNNNINNTSRPKAPASHTKRAHVRRLFSL